MIAIKKQFIKMSMFELMAFYNHYKKKLLVSEYVLLLIDFY